MHLYGVFTSPSFGPVGSAVCVFNYATMANVFQTSSFVVRDTTTLVFNSVTGAPVDNDTGAVRSLLAGPGSVKARVTSSSSTGNMNDLPNYYDNLQSTLLVKSGSFDGSQPSQMHLYGIFTSPSFGPVGSAVCVFNYATMANVFQTSSFVVRDTTTLVFNSVTGAPVDCVKSKDSTPKLLSTIMPQAQGPSPIFSATGHTFRRIVVDQTTGLDNVTYEVMFIVAVN
eukprot:Em0002g159a